MMRFISVLTTICLVYLPAIEAAKFRAPIHAIARNATELKMRKLDISDYKVFKKLNKTGGSSSQEGKSRRGKRGIRQRPVRVGSIVPGQNEEFLKEMKTETEKTMRDESSHLEIWDWNELTYITRLSIGTPPQHFHALLDISSSDLFVPATSCDELCPQRNRYNASASRTHKHHTEHMHSEYLRCLADGQLAEDTLHLGGIEIECQKFGAAKSIIKPDPKFGNDDWDGILGLAPGNKGSSRNIANPFMNMIAQKKLDWNLFSLKLPRGKSDPGEIIFGGIDKDMYEGNLKKVPLVPYDPVHRRRLRDRWVVPASGIGIGHGYASLYGYVATIESDFPGIAIPELYALMLNKYLRMENRDGLREPPSIDCAKREKLEDLTITLAEEKFVLSPWDYTMEMDMGWIDGKKGERRCVSAFMSLPDHLEESFIVLGTPFLRKFYSVFDLGGRTVSFGKLKAPKRESDGKQELKK